MRIPGICKFEVILGPFLDKNKTIQCFSFKDLSHLSLIYVSFKNSSLPPIIMVQWKMAMFESGNDPIGDTMGDTPIFSRKTHDYGRVRVND